ncbi:MAG: glycosyltransferase family 39 protein [Candidatus Omnitrophota bacterium]|jgi:4-amino-4-deoxy-L-arabinose transferase-like glycosyltransferase
MFKEKRFLYILTGSFIFGLVLLFLTKTPMQPDSYSYDAIGLNIANGHGYTDSAGNLTMEREPLYPLFLALVYSMFGHNYFFVQLLQILLFLATTILVYKIAGIIFKEKIAFYSMTVTAFFPTLVNYSSYILSEALFTFLLALVVFLGMKVYFTSRFSYYLLFGMALGLAALCKVIMLPFLFIAVMWLILLKIKSADNKGLIIKIFAMSLIFICLTLPWMSRNYTKFGDFSLREGSLEPLCIKVQKLDYNFNDLKQSLVFILSENLGKKVFPNAVENPRDFLFREDILVREKILPELKSKGYSANKIKNTMIKEIMRRPVKFIAVSSIDLLKMTQFTYLPALIDQEYLIKKISSIRYGSLALSLFRGVFRLLAYLMIAFSVMGMLEQKMLWRKWVFLLIVISYVSLAYAVIYGHGRYSVPLIPYYIILSTAFVIRNKKAVS